MTLGEPMRLSEATSTDLNAAADMDIKHAVRKPTQNALDGSMTDLHTPPIEISTPGIPHTHLDARLTASDGSGSESSTPVWTLTPADSFEPESNQIDRGKGKEVDRGRTNDRNYRAANPDVRAESHPRRLDPTFELISQPVPVRPLPLQRRTGNLSRSSTLHKDPVATLGDEILEHCPHSPICPLAEVLNTPTPKQEGSSEDHVEDSDPAGIDTPSPLTGIFRSDSNRLYELKFTRTSERNPLPMPYNEKPALYPAPTLPPEAFLGVMPTISHLEYLALKSSTKECAESPYYEEDQTTLSQASKDEVNQDDIDKPSLMASIPAEIILQIFVYLGPADFNAVRRVSRTWFIASLDKGILRVMLKRGGWSGSIGIDSATNPVIDGDTQLRVHDEWAMSKKIARECALGPDWSGNGLEPLISPSYPSILGLSEPSMNQESSISSGTTAFRLTKTTDFTEIGIHYPTATPGAGGSGSGTTFTVSVCSKFLMVANGCLIYIYELNRSNNSSSEDRAIDPGELRPITSIVCPRRVLACSMDTSSNRYAIAALLDGRMGLVCDITAPGTGSPRRRSASGSTVMAMGNTYSQASPSGAGRSNITINSSTSNAFERAVTEKPSVVPNYGAHDSLRLNYLGLSTNNFGPNLAETGCENILQAQLRASSMNPQSSSQDDSSRYISSETDKPIIIPRICPFPTTTATATAMPLEYGPRSVYRHLCSDDDPPRSVAICPQRRCVAFGCSAGIELHWVDALTGQDLNRWFPLTAPSDFLYFLPPRRGVDSAKKLRLISSAACPAESSALADRFRCTPFSSGGSRSGLRSFGLRYLSGRDTPVGGLRSDASDHYRAVPLSDGYHILFTNPVTGALCLGSDAPIGGPTKLLRKMWFMGPKGQDRNRPIAYASGSDLSSGIRVVAAYQNEDGNSQSVWFFSVPSDVFKDSQAEQGIIRSAKEKSEGEWRNWWNNPVSEDDWRNPENTPFSSSPNWPVQIRGQEIGSCGSLIDIAIHSGPDITIWAFTRAGTAMAWKIDNGNPDQSIRRRVVLRDGTIRETDEEGDTEMLDVLSDADSLCVELPTPSNLILPDPMQGAFDGTASFSSQTPPPPYVSDTWRYPDEETQITHDIETIDGDGDILMRDELQNVCVKISEYDDDAFSETVEMIRGDEASDLYRSTRWGSRFIEQIGGEGADLVEELTATARIEIEIH